MEDRNGLEDFLDKFRGKRSSSIGSFEFEKEDIQREEVVKEVLDIYEGDNVPPCYMEEKSVDSYTSEDSESINNENDD